jgi:hypothetical protein
MWWQAPSESNGFDFEGLQDLAGGEVPLNSILASGKCTMQIAILLNDVAHVSPHYGVLKPSTIARMAAKILVLEQNGTRPLELQHPIVAIVGETTLTWFCNLCRTGTCLRQPSTVVCKDHMLVKTFVGNSRRGVCSGCPTQSKKARRGQTLTSQEASVGATSASANGTSGAGPASSERSASDSSTRTASKASHDEEIQLGIRKYEGICNISDRGSLKAATVAESIAMAAAQRLGVSMVDTTPHHSHIAKDGGVQKAMVAAEAAEEDVQPRPIKRFILPMPCTPHQT